MVSVKKITFVVLIISFIASLAFNYLHINKQQRVHAWKEYSYNQFVSEVISGGHLLGYQTPWYNPQKASLAIGEAAMALNQLAVYGERTKTKTTPHVKEVANYLSYIALIMADPDQQFKGDEVDGEEYVKNITNLLLEELEVNGVVSDISDEKEMEIFNEMYQLIPKAKIEGSESRIDSFYQP